MLWLGAALALITVPVLLRTMRPQASPTLVVARSETAIAEEPAAEQMY
ncbi:hypothetical protein ACFV0C_38235 [Streptomyces sp. NPDC059568]